MKLYFYNLDTYGSNPKGLYVEECEAEERPKTYAAVDRVFHNYRMPYMDGLELCSKIRQRFPATKLLLFTGFDDFEYAKEAFRNRAERIIADKLEEVEKLKTELKIINESEE